MLKKRGCDRRTLTTTSHKASATSTSTKKSTSTSTPSASGSSWTTTAGAPGALPLADSTFRPTHVLSGLSHSYVSAPDGRHSMQAHFPAGSWTFHDPLGGISFYAAGPADVDLTTAKEATLSYSVFFENGFDFNMGGKLPGIYGGNSEDVAYSCSGGRRDDACFSARLMWRTSGAGEVYTYLPPSFSANDRVCNIPPLSECNPTYGASVGRGAFSFKRGAWTDVTQRIRLNDVGQQNGEIQLLVEGNSVIHATGLVLRNSDSGRMRGIQMQTFFGGSTSEWASPKAQNSYFSDFGITIVEKF
ncbi:polysaccharide lyase family 14 protein [Jaapia argillacea MUCL 33604]|uniref:Polysaccharide lyase family 14 protein n=1 Tax=Jaapia argillacea MUCL 33604 TaxID=933084 RepID=A0A067PY40_9AGAM|nr:polysaccharide lyase family 14 protein [Jaapia argillacea MUCL 33604]